MGIFYNENAETINRQSNSIVIKKEKKVFVHINFEIIYFSLPFVKPYDHIHLFWKNIPLLPLKRK